MISKFGKVSGKKAYNALMVGSTKSKYVNSISFGDKFINYKFIFGNSGTSTLNFKKDQMFKIKLFRKLLVTASLSYQKNFHIDAKMQIRNNYML